MELQWKSSVEELEADTGYKEEISKHCLGQEMCQAFCVRNAKAQLQLRITTRWSASIGAERTDCLAKPPSAIFERFWRLGRSSMTGGMQVLHLSLKKEAMGLPRVNDAWPIWLPFYDKMSGIIDEGRTQNIIYLDFSKASDSLSHSVPVP